MEMFSCSYSHRVSLIFSQQGTKHTPAPIHTSLSLPRPPPFNNFLLQTKHSELSLSNSSSRSDIMATKSGKSNSSSTSDAELRRELEEMEGGKERKEIEISYTEESNRRRRPGLVELVLDLEEEAIVGKEGEGKKPNDYNRRAQIFSTSSKVFQALKHAQDHSSNP